MKYNIFYNYIYKKIILIQICEFEYNNNNLFIEI